MLNACCHLASSNYFYPSDFFKIAAWSNSFFNHSASKSSRYSWGERPRSSWVRENRPCRDELASRWTIIPNTAWQSGSVRQRHSQGMLLPFSNKCQQSGGLAPAEGCLDCARRQLSCGRPVHEASSGPGRTNETHSLRLVDGGKWWAHSCVPSTLSAKFCAFLPFWVFTKQYHLVWVINVRSDVHLLLSYQVRKSCSHDRLSCTVSKSWLIRNRSMIGMLSLWNKGIVLWLRLPVRLQSNVEVEPKDLSFIWRTTMCSVVKCRGSLCMATEHVQKVLMWCFIYLFFVGPFLVRRTWRVDLRSADSISCNYCTILSLTPSTPCSCIAFVPCTRIVPCDSILPLLLRRWI